MAPIRDAVFATLLMNDAYLPGAMVLAHSLKDRKAKGKLVALVLVEKLSQSTISELKTLYDEIVPVQQILNKTPANLYLMDRPDLISTFTKIQLWKQTQYSRIVYIDADVVAIRAPNELLTMDTQFAAVPDIGWPDCFNSGVMVLNPNLADYYALLALAERGISFDGADQGLLNMHFTDWERISFTYNCTPSGNYQYVPAYRHFQSSISMIHFIGKQKPWNLGRHGSQQGGIYGELLGRWWAVFDKHYRGQETIYYAGAWQGSPRKVQDYVTGEETIYLPRAFERRENDTSTGQAVLHPPPVVIHPPPEGAALEQPFGDQPAVEDQIQQQEFTPTPTVEQRRWSAPHVEWEPARAPPPTNSKPEASNFPATIYQMSDSRELFKAPTSYPEAPKDMWYEVPAKAAAPAKPKAIFPWETRAPKPTRIFAEPRLASPPPEPEPEPEPISSPVSGLSQPGQSASTATDSSIATDSPQVSEGVEVTKETYVDPWTTFNQRTNAWDEMPEIAKYMQGLIQAKKGKIQVLHHTPSTSLTLGDLTSLPTFTARRDSVKVTDFPTEMERPSLPVTPAPIRRPTFWGEERDEVSDLPAADGVPKQEQWNPISRLEDLERRQSEIMLNKDTNIIHELPNREMPESASKEALVAATEKAMSPPTKAPLKPILKEPKFGNPAATDTTAASTLSTVVSGTHAEIDPMTAFSPEAGLSPTSVA